MMVLELNEVEVDFCSRCGGVWLDSGELEAVLASRGGFQKPGAGPSGPGLQREATMKEKGA